MPGFWPLFLAVAVALLGLGVISPILPLYMRTFGASGVELGLVFAAFAVARFLGGPLFGRLSDRMNRKPLILLGLGLYALVSVAYTAAQSLWQLGLLRLVQGLASTLVTPQAQAYVAERTPFGREGRTLNLFYTAQFVGMGLGPILGGSLAEHFALTTPFYAMGLLTGLALLAVLFFVPMESRATSARAKGRPPWRAVLSQRELWGIVAYMGTRGFWRQAFNAFFPVLAAERGLSETLIGTVLTLYFLGESALQIPAGYLADLLPHRPQVLVGGMLATVPLFFVPFVSAP
ncbi:MAG: MFS transporter, partial [Candidatus Bipolaricaulaceae bacterium]